MSGPLPIGDRELAAKQLREFAEQGRAREFSPAQMRAIADLLHPVTRVDGSARVLERPTEEITT